MASIKTIHIDDPATWRGGQQQVFYLLKGLKERGHVAQLISQPSSVLGKRASEAGIKVHALRMHGEGDILTAIRIARLIRSGQFDIVHMHSSHAHMLGCMACALNSSPLCVVSRRVDFPVKKVFQP